MAGMVPLAQLRSLLVTSLLAVLDSAALYLSLDRLTGMGPAHPLPS